MCRISINQVFDSQLMRAFVTNVAQATRTDDFGVNHSPETCSEYCCKDLIHRNYKVCCTDRLRQVSSLEMNADSCENIAGNKV
ncbi:hypothetical protein DPMN_116177 [Dreissena polymorpha]|uniref:Uncharacterized protein n=1 Tax=Dreissena polymorpha TaxID=45954 RepID=A0A9D4KNB3_DREPO|nr:hypothetical protein DPMN_116177 [Dreissena polymorpha]